DRLAARPQPCAYAAQHVGLVGHHRAIAFRPDVENVIAAGADHADQPRDVLVDLAGQVLAHLPGTIAPGVREHRRGRLPRLLHALVRFAVVAHHGGVALVVPHAPGDHGLRLQRVHSTGETRALRRRGLAHVEPHFADRTVTAHQLADLRYVEVGLHRCDRVVVVGAVLAVHPVPVDGGVVHAERHVRPRAGLGEHLHHIALVRGVVDDVVAVLRGMEHRETVVVLGGEHDELHARGLGQRHDGIGIELLRIEALGQYLVLGYGHRREGLDLLAVTLRDALAVPYAAQLRVQAEVDKQAKLARLPG